MADPTSPRAPERPDDTLDDAGAGPGNVRELRNVLERAMILSSDGTLHVDLPSESAAPSREAPKTVVAVETEHIRTILEQTGWKIRGSGGAAGILGLKPSTLESRMKKLGIRRP